MEEKKTEEKSYELRVYEWLFKIPSGAKVDINKRTTPETKQKFIDTVKSFMDDGSLNFQLTFSDDYNFLKREKPTPKIPEGSVGLILFEFDKP